MPVDRSGGVTGDIPHISGTRIGVHHIAEKILHGPYSVEDVASDVYPHLSEEDVLDALAYVFEHKHEYHQKHRQREQTLRKASDDAITSPTDLPEDLRD